MVKELLQEGQRQFITEETDLEELGALAQGRCKSTKCRILQPTFLQIQSLQGVFDSLNEISKWLKPLIKNCVTQVKMLKLRKVQALGQVIQVSLCGGRE